MRFGGGHESEIAPSSAIDQAQREQSFHDFSVLRKRNSRDFFYRTLGCWEDERPSGGSGRGEENAIYMSGSLFPSPSRTGRGICFSISSSWDQLSSFTPKWVLAATPSVHDQPWAALLWVAAGRLLSQCRQWGRREQERNYFPSTNIFSFLLLKLDGRPHGEVKRAVFSSEDCCSLPGGRS